MNHHAQTALPLWTLSSFEKQFSMSPNNCHGYVFIIWHTIYRTLHPVALFIKLSSRKVYRRLLFPKLQHPYVTSSKLTCLERRSFQIKVLWPSGFHTSYDQNWLFHRWVPCGVIWVLLGLKGSNFSIIFPFTDDGKFHLTVLVSYWFISPIIHPPNI